MKPDAHDLDVSASPAQGSRAERMAAVADAIWNDFGRHVNGKVSWVGFYLDQPSEPDDRRLILGPHRDQPACSPIGLHGACGRALLSRETQIIRDVADLGEAYIACDPRDRSEIVIPLFDETGECYGVLDVDSWEVGAFDEGDERRFRAALLRAGLTCGDSGRQPG